MEDRFPIIEIFDHLRIFRSQDSSYDLRVILPGQAMPNVPVALRDEIFLDICGALRDATEAETVFAPSFRDLDEHLPSIIKPRLWDILMNLFNKEQERLFQLLFFREEMPSNFFDQFFLVFFMEIPGHIENDGNVFLEGEFRDLFCVFSPDL
jgi:hypothetical protein